jgi:hypothetical protein
MEFLCGVLVTTKAIEQKPFCCGETKKKGHCFQRPREIVRCERSAMSAAYDLKRTPGDFRMQA